MKVLPTKYDPSPPAQTQLSCKGTALSKAHSVRRSNIFIFFRSIASAADHTSKSTSELDTKQQVGLHSDVGTIETASGGEEDSNIELRQETPETSTIVSQRYELVPLVHIAFSDILAGCPNNLCEQQARCNNSSRA